MSGATPLAAMRAGNDVDLMSLIVGRVPGTIGEVSVIALLIGAVYMIARKVISPRIPLVYIGTVAVFIFLFGGFDITYVAKEVCAGGLIFGAFFMATDYVTSPLSKTGQVVYGLFLGILTGIFRLWGASPEGVSYAIILGNPVSYTHLDVYKRQGGQSPNVVQPKAQVLYMVRAKLMKDAMKLQARVDKIAEAAAMMTETTMKKKFIDGCSNTVPNKVLEQLLYKNFDQVGVPSYTESELEFAKKLNDSCELAKEGLPGSMVDESFEAQEFVDEASCHGTKAMNDFLIPYIYSEKMRAGSTDVGDVSWNTPTAQIRVACFTARCV